MGASSIQIMSDSLLRMMELQTAKDAIFRNPDMDGSTKKQVIAFADSKAAIIASKAIQATDQNETGVQKDPAEATGVYKF